jgi:hypothetical protein
MLLIPITLQYSHYSKKMNRTTSPERCTRGLYYSAASIFRHCCPPTSPSTRSTSACSKLSTTRRAPRVSANTTRAASKASSTPSSSRGKGALSANTPAYRWCWCLTSAQGISHMPVRRTHLSSAARRIRSCSESERKNAIVGEFCKFRITSFTSSVRATRLEACTSSTVRLHFVFFS